MKIEDVDILKMGNRLGGSSNFNSIEDLRLVRLKKYGQMTQKIKCFFCNTKKITQGFFQILYCLRI